MILVDSCIYINWLREGVNPVECLHPHQYGLKLIAKNTGQTEFTITKKMVENTDGELSEMVLQSYSR